ncbi:serine/threonine-protein kinase ATM-like isoform X3 [Zingiber officinale]|uniref:serine/threonine-protein kinase ATM-like isoform X3 n=1 Tax=Zingiber officinale TaxID=94328 RepID=UPI001C4A8C75|nr:serine/threonine-protein kinase ATM-like isoform X3 [Zingiber officinale]
MATSRDVQEIISKLSSDKAKAREEGVKLLSSWLEGERSVDFCKLLSRNTAKIKPDEIPHSETWPFLVTLLMRCISSEISTSKKRPPKLIFAKTLRMTIQYAEDARISGNSFLLFSVVKVVFNHALDVIKDVPSYQLEYNSILRHLLTVKEYRYQMRKRVYCGLIVLYTTKLGTLMDLNPSQAGSNEDSFRTIVILYVLLENPPGDYPDNIREDVVQTFTKVFFKVRNEGKVLRKLMECLNIYLLRDGPNLGHQALEIHSAVKEIIFRCWLTTHDQGLKSSFINYMRIQLSLIRSLSEGAPIIEQFLDVITKEFDHGINVAGVLWYDVSKDDKSGSLGSIRQSLMELAATVFYQACRIKCKATCTESNEKRLKMEHAAGRVKDGIMKASCLRNGAFSFLIHNYGLRLDKTLLIYWFEGAIEGLKRILGGSTLNSHDALLWLLRALQGFSSVFLFHGFHHLEERPKNSWFTSNEITNLRNCWQEIWSYLMRGLLVLSSFSSIIDVTLTLLGNMIERDQVSVIAVPQDIWDLRTFKHMPTMSTLYFVTSYFSQGGAKGDVRDVLYLRKDLLRAVLEIFEMKQAGVWNAQMVALVPEAVFSLCAGTVSPVPSGHLSMAPRSCEDCAECGQILLMTDELEHLEKVLECSVEALAEIKCVPSSKEKTSCHSCVCLPNQIRQPLIHELKEHLADFVTSNSNLAETSLSSQFYLCSLLCNSIYYSIISRITEGDKSVIHAKVIEYILMILDHIVLVVEDRCNELRCYNFVNIGFVLDSAGSTASSLCSLLSSPLFKLLSGNDGSVCHLVRVTHAIEKLLVVFGKLFNVLSNVSSNMPEIDHLSVSSMDSSQCIIAEHSARIVDMELDAYVSSKDVDLVALRGNKNSISSTPLQWKLELVSIISNFYAALPCCTWEILSEMMGKENDSKVRENILFNLCKHFSGPSGSLSALVSLISDFTNKDGIMKFYNRNILTCINVLLKSLESIYSSRNSKKKSQVSNESMPFEDLNSLCNILNAIAEVGLADWYARIELINCISCLVLIEPQSAQVLIERLLVMLQDPDYRVRLFLARKISLLFQTWDGHNELFNDICLNFGLEMVRFGKGKTVKAHQILDAGPQGTLFVETALITLAHLALASEEIEIEAAFMMCVVAAMEPSERELVYALLDNLSRSLQYASKSKYLEQLIGPILARWVACDVNLMSLIEVQSLFCDESSVKCFVKYCCPWLLPPLMLSGDNARLNWISKVSLQPLSDLVKEYFVPICASCIAVYCSMRSDKEIAGLALNNSILQFGKISEVERDELVKKNMVSIVSFLLSLTSCSVDPELPYFTKDTVVLAVQTVVDGFLDIDTNHISGVVDKINIFRPDRIFMFLLEIHYQITAAVHTRHICHRLSAMEVLTRLIGHRATNPSSSYYIMSIIGQLICSQFLQEQCCIILSTLLEAFKTESGKDAYNVLGEQLQFLVSKLVSCCIPTESQEEKIAPLSPRIISLLHELIVDADPLLLDHIKELEPFPEVESLEKIRLFHDDLCQGYSVRDQLLKFAKRAYYLPKGLLIWSLRNLHKKLMSGEIIGKKTNDIGQVSIRSFWDNDPDVISAVWMLVDLCSSNEENVMSGMLADFMSRTGIGDPCHVVFHLPTMSTESHTSRSLDIVHLKEKSASSYSEVSDDLLIYLLRLLKKFLADDSVEIVDITSRTLRGILSTEKGFAALSSLDAYEKSLVVVHSKGVNIDVVEKMLLDMRKTSDGAVSLEDSSLWTTHSKTYKMWVCTLVHSLILHCDDIILRLCQNIVLRKEEIAELLFPNVLVNIAKTIGSDNHLCHIISQEVEKNIFCDSNDLVKSIQTMLSALNKLRSIYVAEIAGSFSTSMKHSRTPTGTKTRGASATSKDRSLNVSMSKSSWKKVYWLSIDYLVVAKAAVHCGSYFTAVLYIEHWCEERFNGLQLGYPDFSHLESSPPHVDLLMTAFEHINEPDSIYGIVQTNQLTSQIVTFEHEGNWNKALEYYDLLVRSASVGYGKHSFADSLTSSQANAEKSSWKFYKGLMRSLQKTGCTHILDVYCHGLTNYSAYLQHDSEFADLQYEAAWRSGNWDFSLVSGDTSTPYSRQSSSSCQFNENLHSCLRSLYEGNASDFHAMLLDSKKDLLLSIASASRESTEYIHSAIVKLQILDHLGVSWDIRWKPHNHQKTTTYSKITKISHDPVIPTEDQLGWFKTEWRTVLRHAQLHLNLFEPLIAFRRVLFQILDCKEFTTEHLLESASTFRKGSRFSLAASALNELKQLCCQMEQKPTSQMYFLGRLEEAKLLRAQGQHDMAINLARYIVENNSIGEKMANIYRLVGKWLAETRSSNSRIILEQYLKHSVEVTELSKSTSKKYLSRQCQSYYQLAHYADGLFQSYEARLASSEWQAALRLRKHKTRELDALIKRLKGSSKGEKIDYSIKIQELQKQLTMDREEAEKLHDDRENFLSLALEGYRRCLVIGGKYDMTVVFRLVSLWFNFYSRNNVVDEMISTVKEVQSYKFIPLVYQIASRLGIYKDGQSSTSFQIALVSLVRKMAIDHPYHTIFQLLALANGDRVKDKQRSRNSFVVDMDKKLAAENLLNELLTFHGALIRQMKQLVEIYIKLAELETKKEETNRRVPLPREIRNIRQLELVPVVTATVPVDPTCQYQEGSFPHFKGLADSVMVMNGINAPKVIECLGSDGHIYRQLAKSGNDDLRQDAVMEQFFDLVNNFLQNNRDTWKRRLRIRTYKVVPFTPSAGILEWVDRTIPLGEYLLGSARNGGAHGRYGVGDWTFLQCREFMMNEKDKRKAFVKICDNFRSVLHYFFLEKFLQPADWFQGRLSYTRSVAASSMVGYIVGLGDRHSMNILIDQETAEVVHIDLGVAFEQGLMLKTPERVPFRLTRDIIDGMGVTGVEGVFRRCCEETLSVMRANKEALLTIIEVFIHDPLYKWALSPLKALQLQKETDDGVDASLESSQDDEGNKDAARATLRIKEKLDGYEAGEIRSVQGQVQQLIQDAIDIDRLCHMFPGWAAWL